MDKFLKVLDARWGPKRVFWGLVVIFVLLLVLSLAFFSSGRVSVKTSDVSTGRGATYPSRGFDESFPLAPGIPSYEKGGVRDGAGASPSSTETAERKVSKFGTLDLRVENADSAADEIIAIASRHDGFVENVYLTEVRAGVKSGTVTIRVPSATFDAALLDVKRLALRVDAERISISDVTVQYIDLEAQLTNLVAEEAQYRKILDRAVKIEDVLAVTARLSEVRTRIDSYRSQLQYLSRQVEMATLAVNLTAEPQGAVLDTSWRPLTIIRESLKNLVAEFIAFVNALITLLFLLPIFLLKLALIALVAWIIWKIVLWFRHAVLK